MQRTLGFAAHRFEWQMKALQLQYSTIGGILPLCYVITYKINQIYATVTPSLCSRDRVGRSCCLGACRVSSWPSPWAKLGICNMKLKIHANIRGTLSLFESEDSMDRLTESLFILLHPHAPQGLADRSSFLCSNVGTLTFLTKLNLNLPDKMTTTKSHPGF